MDKPPTPPADATTIATINAIGDTAVEWAAIDLLLDAGKLIRVCGWCRSRPRDIHGALSVDGALKIAAFGRIDGPMDAGTLQDRVFLRAVEILREFLRLEGGLSLPYWNDRYCQGVGQAADSLEGAAADRAASLVSAVAP